MNLTKKIKQAKKILIVGHVRPDGDCLGAGLALYRLAQKSGTQAELVYDSDLPFHYSFMQYYDCINKASLSDYDLLIIVDCGDRFRMGKYATTTSLTTDLQMKITFIRIGRVRAKFCRKFCWTRMR